MKTCKNCKWWKDANLTAQIQSIEVDENGYAVASVKALGYCEPPHSKMWKGLTAEDYSCGEHTPKEDKPS